MVFYQQFACGQLGTNCYVVYDETKRCVIVDGDGDGQAVMDFIRREGLTCEMILLTHAHFDHIGAAQAFKRAYGCDICLGALDADLLGDPWRNLSAMMGEPFGFAADRLFQDGDTFTVGTMHFTVLLTPGHTQGSVCYVVDTLLLSGDTLFAGSCGRMDFPTGSQAQMSQSLRRLAALDGDYTVLPGHEGSTTLSRERRVNPYLLD